MPTPPTDDRPSPRPIRGNVENLRCIHCDCMWPLLGISHKLVTPLKPF